MSKHVNLSESRRYASGSLTGAEAAADFTIDVGFEPTFIRVINLTDRIGAEHIVDPALDGASNAKSLLTVATGTRTYAAAGISVSNRSFTVDISIATLGATAKDVFWEAYA